MPVGPDKIGNNSETTRQSVQDNLTQILDRLASPSWVRSNNTHPRQADGGYRFTFSYPGEISTAEKQTLEDGWVNAGWTTATASNGGIRVSDPDRSPYYTFVLNKDPA